MTETNTYLVPCTIGLTIIYTLLLILPSTPVKPRFTIKLSLLFTIVLPFISAITFMVFVSNNIRSNGFGFAPEWTPKLHGKLANHNFCEEDYRYTSYIAEFHNTWSSLPIIFYGSVGPYYTRKYATKELRFSFAFISIGAVGIGSALFHGTLLRIGQVFDEVPMLCIIFVGIFCFVENQKLPKYGIWFPIALITSCLFWSVHI